MDNKEMLYKKMDAFLKTNEEKIGYLWSRWQDEKEYEDFKDYESVMKTMIMKYDKNAKFLKSFKRPFGFVFQDYSINYVIHVSCTAKSLGWKAKKIIN